MVGVQQSILHVATIELSLHYLVSSCAALLDGDGRRLCVSVAGHMTSHVLDTVSVALIHMPHSTY
jgi:hypothetical protein